MKMKTGLASLLGLFFLPPVYAEDAPAKAKIVVLPAIYAQQARSKFEKELAEQFGLSDPSAVENPDFSAHLVDSLVNCRKFDVMEREKLRDVVKEIDFGESDYANAEKCARIGQMLNADYVVVPEIRFVLFIREKKDVPYIPDGSRVKYEATMGTQVRVVDVRTSRIASSNIAENTYATKQARKEKDRIKQAINFVSELYSTVAAAEVAVIIDVIYPIKILSIEGDTVTINRGKGAISEGEILAVFRKGEVLQDPDTKETLGFHESEVGKIKVSRVLPKFSLALVQEVQEGEKIEKFQICRRVKEPAPVRQLPSPPID